MSILIKGMEMPTGCGALTLNVWPDGQVEIIDADGEWKTSEAIPIPPHGRLIDADILTETTDGIWDCNDLYFQPNDKICDPSDCKGCKWRETMDCFRRMVKHAPTIIPARRIE